MSDSNPFGRGQPLSPTDKQLPSASPLGGPSGGYALDLRFKHTTSSVAQGSDSQAPQVTNEKSLELNASTSDIIAISSGVIALLFAVSMIAGWVPINTMTISVITFAAVMPGLATIISRGRKSRTPKSLRPAVKPPSMPV